MVIDKDVAVPAVRDAAPAPEGGPGPTDTVLDEPTSAATVSIGLTPDGPEVSATVPGEWSGHLLRTLGHLGTTVATVVGPVVVLNASRGADLPWPAVAGLALLLTLMPLVLLLLSDRRARD
ncbi:hypothetical protein [Streptomyces sp. URMC 123]|uniref:hypothetical protein n=1 Tax=Streptomyces sp. URMC 123 TaxID=3423403 RepID=UPI003F1E1B1C